jgi:hypothetical protein
MFNMDFFSILSFKHPFALNIKILNNIGYKNTLARSNTITVKLPNSETARSHEIFSFTERFSLLGKT